MSLENIKGRLEYCEKKINKFYPGGLKEYIQELHTEYLKSDVKTIDDIVLDYIDLLFDYIEKLENNKN